VKDLIGQGLSLKDAVASIETLGRVATATGSNLTEVTRTGYQLQNALKIKPTELKATFDALAYAGKQGAFELKDMAQFMPTIASAAADLGISGKKGAIELAAMMQMVRKNAPDSAQAATRLTDALMKMTAPDAVKNFKKFGVDIKKVMSDARKRGINPMEAAVNELRRVTGGDIFKLSQIFGDKEAKLALMALMKYRKEYAKLRDEAGGSAAAGTVDKDYQKSIGTFAQRMQAFQNTMQRLGISVGNALLPPLTAIAESLTPVVEGIATWAEKNPVLMQGIIGLSAAFVGITAALPIIGAVVAAIGVATLPVTAAIVGVGVAIGLVIAYWPQISAAAAAAWQYVTGLWGQFGGWWAGVWSQSATVVQNGVTAIQTVMSPLPTIAQGVFNSLPVVAQGAFNQVRSTVQSTFAGIVAYLQSVPGMLVDVGRKIIQTIIDGIRAKAAELVATVQGVFQKVRQLMPFSDAKKGPFSQLTASGMAIPATLGEGVRRGAQSLVQPMAAVATAAMVSAPATGAPLPMPPVSASGGGVTITAPITINAGPGADPQAIAAQVRQVFEDLLRDAESAQRAALND
jgi:TP901 family phage tail tape measure protein